MHREDAATIMVDSWEVIGARKVQEQQKRIPKEWRLPAALIDVQRESVLDIARDSGILTSTDLHLTEDFSAVALIDELAHGRIKSEALTRAYCKRAAIAAQVSNCLTEIFFDDAIARARQLDAILSRDGRPIGPLHGLPVSVKDSFNVKGYDSSLGIAALCFKPANSNSALIDLLLSLGAVLFCKTNVPQTLSALDSHNNIFGRTLNPRNRALTAGGSSGGEGALVALNGSPLGVGTDVGGSIRVPAMCNGVFGVKPSHGRIPYTGQQSSMRDGTSRLTIEAAAGPIARSLEDCIAFLRIVADSHPEAVDPGVFLQPWALQPSLPQDRRLRVGVISWDGHTRPLPCVAQFMRQVIAKLSQQPDSIEIIEVDAAPLLAQCVKLFNGLVSVDGANAWFDLLDAHQEPLSPWLQNRLRRRPNKGAETFADLQIQKHAFQTQFLKIWQRNGGYWRSKSDAEEIDVVLCLPAPHPVAPVDRWNTVNYTSAWNVLDYPAGILPVRTVMETDIAESIHSIEPPLNGWDKINRELWTQVDRQVYLGSPLCLQVVTPRLEERKLVESMAVIAGCLGLSGNAASSSKL